MTIKELSQLYWLSREIETDQKRLDGLAAEIRRDQMRLEEMRMKADSPSGASLTGMLRSPSHDNRIERYVTDIIDLESIIKEKRSALSEYAMAVHARQMLCIHERNKLERYISSIQDRYIQRIFRFRFIDCLTWNEVAERVGNSNSPDSIKKLCYRYVNKGAEGQTE